MLSQTESARELRRAFFCELCQKGYARINELEAHDNSYDHQHRKRLKEMKALTGRTTAANKASRDSKKRNDKSEMISVNLQADASAPSSRAPGRVPGFKDDLAESTANGSKPPASEATARGFLPIPGPAPTSKETSKSPHGSKEERRTLDWEELDRLYDLVDQSKLPPEMQRCEPTGYLKMCEEWRTNPAKSSEWCQNVYGKMTKMQSEEQKNIWRSYEEGDDGSDLAGSDSD